MPLIQGGPPEWVWERTPDHEVDFGHLRLGAGPISAQVPVEIRAPRGVRPPSVQVAEGPLTVDLAVARVLGVAGAPEVADAVTRSLKDSNERPVGSKRRGAWVALLVRQAGILHPEDLAVERE